MSGVQAVTSTHSFIALSPPISVSLDPLPLREQQGAQMPTQFLVVRLHSIADVVTNSSSELFIGNSDFSEPLIYAWLEDLAKVAGCHHGIGRVRCIQGVEGLKTALQENNWYMFGEYSQNTGRSLMFKFWDYSKYGNLPEPENLPQKPGDIDYNLLRSLPQEEAREMSNAHYEAEQAWQEEVTAAHLKIIDDNKEKFEDGMLGVVILESSSDNSVPYEMFDMIEAKFNAERIHLG